jgi:predicted Zn-dependent protease
LFEILRHEQAHNPGRVEAFLSTHPSPEDRIERLRRAAAGARRGRRDARRFQLVRARVLKLPPPKRSGTS